VNHRTRTLAVVLCLLPLLAALPGCYSPKPETKLELTIANDGGLTLEGKALSLQQLRQALAERAAPKNSIIVEIHAAPDVDVKAIQAVVQVAKQTAKSVAFATPGSAP
jgi:biopolymer transport protein ExbD